MLSKKEVKYTWDDGNYVFHVRDTRIIGELRAIDTQLSGELFKVKGWDNLLFGLPNRQRLGFRPAQHTNLSVNPVVNGGG